MPCRTTADTPAPARAPKRRRPHYHVYVIELSPDVRVNGIAPGPIEWPEDQQFSPDERQAIIAHTLLKREGRPEDIARTAHFLICEAPYITGQVIAVDGESYDPTRWQ